MYDVGEGRESPAYAYAFVAFARVGRVKEGVGDGGLCACKQSGEQDRCRESSTVKTSSSSLLKVWVERASGRWLRIGTAEWLLFAGRLGGGGCLV